MARIFGGLPCRLDKDGDLMIWKDGVWHPSGECFVCDDLGLLGFHCRRCAPLGYLYVGPALTLDDVVVNPLRLGAIANLVQTSLAAEPKPEAACSHFLLLLASLWLDAFPQYEGD
jgi:hypothetical protein